MASKKQKERKAVRYAEGKKRQEEHGKGGGFNMAYKLPPKIEPFKFEEAKTYYLDILPFIASKNNVYCDEPGQAYWECTIFVHPKIGPEEKNYLCPMKHFKKKCPVCEDYATSKAKGMDKDYLSSLRPKERQLFLVKDRDEKKSPTRLLDMAHFGGQGSVGFGERIDQIRDKGNDKNRYREFFHLTDGKSLEIETKKKKFNKTTYYAPIAISMIDREEDYDESLIDELPCLDDLLIETSYKDLQKAYDGGVAAEDDDDDEEGDSDTEDDSEPEPKKKGGKKPAKKDDGEDDDEGDSDTEDSETEDDSETEEKPAKKGAKKPSKKDKEDEDEDEDDDDDDDEDEDEDDSEPEPKKGDKKTPAKKSAKKDDDDDDEGDSDTEDDDDEDSSSPLEDDDDDDDEDDSEPEPKKKGGKKK